MDPLFLCSARQGSEHMPDDVSSAPVAAPEAAAPPETVAPRETAPPVTPTGDPLDMDALSAEVDADLDRIFGPKDPERGPANPPRDNRGRFQPKAEQPDPVDEPVAAADPEPVAAAESEPVAETPPPPAPAIDEEGLRREYFAKLEREETERRENEAAAKRAQEAAEAHERSLQAYRGPQNEYTALREALDDDDDINAVARIQVTDPRTGQLRTGLTLEQGKALMRSWNMARQHEQTLSQIQGQQILNSWGAALQAAVRGDPDLDPKVLEHVDPASMVKIVKASTEAAVTKRLTTAHAAELAARDKQIKALTDRVADLTTDGSNRQARQWAETAATPDQPGRGASTGRTQWTPERVAALSESEYVQHEREILDFMDAHRRRAG